MKYAIGIAACLLISVSSPGQDYIERTYFPNARARNAAIAAARYAEEGYHYTRFTTYINAVDSSRIYADTALFFVKRSMMLCDTSLYHAPPSNKAALDYLLSGKERVVAADSVIKGFYPMTELRSHHYFGREATYHLSGSVMDFFSASLLLRPEDEADNDVVEAYEVLPFDDEVTRLEADEVAFQHLVNAYENEVRMLESLAADVNQEIDKTNDQKTRTHLRSWRDELNQQIAASSSGLEDAAFRIQEIRVLLDRKYLKELEGVEEAEHLAQFETSGQADKVSMDEQLPDGLLYKIQLGYYPADTDTDNFRGLFPITGETVHRGLSRIYAGMFYSYADASKGLDYVRNNAIANAFIVPFQNGAKIPLSRAIELEKARGLK